MGHVTLTQSDVNGNVTLTGTLSGLPPLQKHGLSVCSYGDISKGAATCGSIFNPFGTYRFIHARTRNEGDWGEVGVALDLLSE